MAVEDDTSLSTNDLDADDGIGSVAETLTEVEGAADTTVTTVDAGGNTSDGSELTDEQQEQIAAITTAADTDEAIDSYRQGRRSTIATSAQGLLASAPTRPTRSLMGGMIQ